MPRVIIRNLAIQGFKSFDKDEILDFPDHAGFFLVRGDNQLYPRLGGNACGKSNIWDAMSWVFFGKTTRGVRGPSLKNWDSEELCSVHIEFDVDTTSYGLFRTQDPNALSLTEVGREPKAVKQDEVDKLIGTSWEGFCRIVLMSQFGKFFFDLGPTEKLTVFSDLLNLQYWVDRSTLATSKASATEKLHTIVVIRASHLRGKKDSLGIQLTALNDDLKEFKQNYETDCALKLKELVDAQTAEIGLKAVHEVLVSPGSNPNLQVLDKTLLDLRGELTMIMTAVQSRMVAIGRKETSIADLRRRYAAERDATKCPSCGQALTGERLEQHDILVQNLYDDINSQTRLLSGDKKALEEEQALQKKINEQYAEVKDEVVGLQETFRESQARQAKATQDYNQAVSLTTWRKEAYEKAKGAQDLYSPRIAQTVAELEVLAEELEETEAEMADYKVKTDQYRFWADEFKKIRLWLVEEALVELEIETNAVLEQLGLEGWRISFDTERSNVSGSVTREFSVFVWPPGREEPVPWESWCGGETQRLRIAGARGLMNLESGRRGVYFNLEVWDEPTAHLNEGGIQDLLAYFEAYARSADKQVWMVDHHSLNYGGFDDVITVVMDGKGSRFEYGKESDVDRRSANRKRILAADAE